MGEFKNQEQGFLASNVSGNTVNSPKGYSKFEVKGMIEWGKKKKKETKKIPRPSSHTPKNPAIGNFKPQKILRFIPVTWNPEYSTWGQLSHCRHVAITVTPLIRTAAESQTEIYSSYNGLEIAIEDTKSSSLQCPL